MSKGPAPYDDVYLDEQGSSDEDEGAVPENSKPLISDSRRPKKSKIQVRHPVPKKASYYKRKKCFLKWCYLTVALICVLLFVFVLVKVVHDALSGRRPSLTSWDIFGHEELVPCSGFTAKLVWAKNFPTITTETAIRMVDVNRDGILDAIVGFGTMVGGLFADDLLLCDIYYNNQRPCSGGMMALDGNTGEEIWKYYSVAEIFAVNCNEDIDRDGVKDCLGAGRAGQFDLINGATGRQMWTFADKDFVRQYISNLYTPVYIEDIDGDHIPDVINIHGGDPLRNPGEDVKVIAKVIVFSGRTGEILAWSEVPDKLESYYSPQIYSQSDGTKVFLFGTGGETHGGRFYAVNLTDVIKGNIDKARVLFQNPFKGVMTPPVLVDITNDDVVDIIFLPFNGSVIALNGETFETIWNVTIPYSESYSTPGTGYYNDDEIPDFLIVFNYGPGYPLYYYSQVTILDGRNGALLIDPPIISSGGVAASSLAVSFEGWGNDAFIYWSLVCKGHEHETTAFKYEEGVMGGARSRANFCKERFGTDDITKQSIINQNMAVPGDTIYDSGRYFEIEHANPVNATHLALNFLKENPLVKEQALQKALHRGQEKNEEKPQVTTPVPPSPIKDPSRPESGAPEASNGNDDIMEKFLSYLDNFDPEERRKMIQGLLAEESSEEPEDLDTRDFDLDFDLRDGGVAYKPLVNSERRGGGGETEASYPPHNLEDFLYNLQRGGSYPPSYPGSYKDRRRRGFGEEELTEERRGRRHLGIHDPDEELIRSADGMFSKKRHRGRRHLGSHDAEGVQRLLATGSLAPPLDSESVVRGDSIDVVFPVYWFYPADTHLVLPEEEECMKGYMDDEGQRMDPNNQFYGLDHDGFINSVEEICIKKENVDKLAAMTDDMSISNLYPFNFDAGIMTVYRLRLMCKCTATAPGQRCARILPYQEQKWPAYLGRNGDCMFGS